MRLLSSNSSLSSSSASTIVFSTIINSSLSIFFYLLSLLLYIRLVPLVFSQFYIYFSSFSFDLSTFASFVFLLQFSLFYSLLISAIPHSSVCLSIFFHLLCLLLHSRFKSCFQYSSHNFQHILLVYLFLPFHILLLLSFYSSSPSTQFYTIPILLSIFTYLLSLLHIRFKSCLQW